MYELWLKIFFQREKDTLSSSGFLKANAWRHIVRPQIFTSTFVWYVVKLYLALSVTTKSVVQ